MDFRQLAGKPKARQCFKRCSCNRVQSIRFESNKPYAGLPDKRTVPIRTVRRGVNDHPQVAGGLVSGHRPGNQKHVSALNVAVVTGRNAPGLKTTN